MQEKITGIFDNIENRFKQALGLNVAFVKFPEQFGSKNSANLAIEITLTADYESGANFAKNDDLINAYLRNVGMKGDFKRSIIQNESGKDAVVYTINLSTTEREFSALGYLGAKWDDLTLNQHTAKGFADKTGKLIEAIDRDFKPDQGWAYAAPEIRVIEQGSGLQPNAAYQSAQPQTPANVLSINFFDNTKRDAVAQGYVDRFGKVEDGVQEVKAPSKKLERTFFDPARFKAALKARVIPTEKWIDAAHEVADGGKVR